MGCRPTDGLAILWVSRLRRLALLRRRARSWRRYPSHGPSSERRRHLTGLGGECEIVLRTYLVSRLISEADRGPRLAALPENRPRRNQVAPVCPSYCSPVLPKPAVLLALTAGVAGEPSTLATARLGTLTVTSSVLVSAKAVDMRGVWNDTAPRAGRTSASRSARARSDSPARTGAGRPVATTSSPARPSRGGSSRRQPASTGRTRAAANGVSPSAPSRSAGRPRAARCRGACPASPCRGRGRARPSRARP